MKIKQLEPLKRPREKAIHEGLESLNDSELLSLFIRSGTSNHSALDLSNQILSKCGGIESLPRITQEELCQISGISLVKSLEILALSELAQRLIRPVEAEKISLNHLSKILEWLRLKFGYKQQEYFVVLYLNVNYHMLGYRTLFMGTVDRSIVSPREIFKNAFNLNAKNLILVHNHPGGKCYPSIADCEVTEELVEASRLMMLHIIDHIIITANDHHSIRASHPFLFETL